MYNSTYLFEYHAKLEYDKYAYDHFKWEWLYIPYIK